MKQELQNKIFQKYSSIFQDKDKPKTESCMHWGLSCGDGWYSVIDRLCHNLMKIEKEYDIKIIAEQVKEKYGTLRFYYYSELGPRWTVKKNPLLELLNKVNEYSLPRWIGKPIIKIKTFYNNRKYYFDGKNKIPLHEIFRKDKDENMSAYSGIYKLISEYVSLADYMSSFVCEKCGMSGARTRNGGWIHVLCDSCEKEKNQKHN